MPTISVIVPVYNVEPYLRRCVDSILVQTFTDFELILVDDGSPDNCGAICDEYAQLDDRIRVIHKKNGGVSSARNKGLDAAQGKYVMFCDSDDWVEPEWCQLLFQHANEHPGCLIVHSLSRRNSKEDYESGEKNTEEIDFFELTRRGVAVYVFNRIFFRDIIERIHLRFDESRRYGEDALFTLVYFQYMHPSVYYINQPLYHYCDISTSASHQYYQNWMELHFDMFFLRLRFFSEEQRAAWCDEWIYYFVHMFDSVFDKRNKMPFIEKLHYNQRMINSKEVRYCFEHATWKKESKLTKKILMTHNYYLFYIFQMLCKMKKDGKR